jgi:hypothetical protein
MGLFKRLFVGLELGLFSLLLLFFWHWIPFLVFIFIDILFIALGDKLFKKEVNNV